MDLSPSPEVTRLEALVALARARASAVLVASRSLVIDRPGVPSGGNAVATWPEVQGAVTAANGAITVELDGQTAACHVPASSGTTDCEGATVFTSYNQLGGAGGPAQQTLTIDDGAVLHRPRSFTSCLVVCACTTTTALTFDTTVAPTDTLVLSDVALSLAAGATVPAIAVGAGGRLDIICHSLITLFDSSLAGATPLITLGANAVLFITAFGGVSFSGTNTVTGPASATINFSHDDLSPLPNFAAMGFAGTVVEFRSSFASEASPSQGITANRPAGANVYVGQIYYDTQIQALVACAIRGSPAIWAAPTEVRVIPFGADPTGAADSSVAFQTAITNSRPAGIVPKVDPGTYTIAHPLQIVANDTFKACPGATINSTIPFVDSFTDCLFTTNWNAVAGSTLAANVVEGSYTVSVVTTAGLLGQYVLLDRNGDAGLSFLVTGVGVTGTANVKAAGLYGGGGTLNGTTLILNVNGAGLVMLNLAGAGNTATVATFLAAIVATWPALSNSFTLRNTGPGPNGNQLVLIAGTSLVVGAGSANAFLGLTAGASNTIALDVPCTLAFQTGDAVNVLTTHPYEIHMDFGGATVTGTGGRTCWFAGLWDSVIENLTVDSSWTVFGLDYDLGSRRSVFRNCVVNGVAQTSGGGFVIESGQDSACEKCSVVGDLHMGGFYIGGVGHKITECNARRCGGVGLNLTPMGATDIFAARYCQVASCNFDGNGSAGVILTGNSIYNELSDVSCSYNFVGFSLSPGTFTAITQGVSNNVFTGCHANGNTLPGFAIGDGATSPVDSNTFVGCYAEQNGTAGFQVLALTTNTMFSGCVARGNGVSGAGITDGFNVNTTGSVVADGCITGGNPGYGFNVVAGNVTISDFQSIGDTTGGIEIQGTALAEIEGAHLEQTAAGVWTGIAMTGSGKCRISGVLIVAGGGGGNKLGIYPSGTSDVWIDNVRTVNCAWGLVLGVGTNVNIGPGCDFDSSTIAPLNLNGGTATMVQTGGVAAIPGTSTPVALTFAQHYNTAIELAVGATADTTVVAYQQMVGQRFTARNLSAHNLLVKSTTGATITIAAGKSAEVAINAAGVMTRVTQDSPSYGPFVYAASTSLTTAVAQNIPPGSGATSSSTDLVLGTLATQAGSVSSLAIQHTGNVANVGGQTVTYQIYKNGVAVTGAVAAGVVTTAGNKTANVAFTPVAFAIGDSISAQLLPSAPLTAALVDVMVSVS